MSSNPTTRQQPMTVVIQSTRGRDALLKRTLETVAACDLPGNFLRLLVVEDSGTRDLCPYVADLPAQLRAEHLSTERSGTSASQNRALAEIDQGLIVFFDDDVRVGPNVLQAYGTQQQARPGKWFFGGPTSVDYEAQPEPWLGRYLPCSARGFTHEGDPQVDAPRFLGFNWAAYAEDLHAIGGFDESRGPGGTTDATGDETDAQRRLLASGAHGWYVPEARVWHYVPRQRCSPAWAIDRIHRVGIEHGMNVAPTEQAARHRSNVVLSRRLRAPLRYVLAHVLPGRERRFRDRYWRSHDRGFLLGQRLRRQQTQPHKARGAKSAQSARGWFGSNHRNQVAFAAEKHGYGYLQK